MLVSKWPLLFRVFLANDEQLRKGLPTPSHTMAYARASLDGGDEVQEGQYGSLFETGVGLERLNAPPTPLDTTMFFSFWIYA
jgi:hypothetical protein